MTSGFGSVLWNSVISKRRLDLEGEYMSGKPSYETPELIDLNQVPLPPANATCFFGTTFSQDCANGVYAAHNRCHTGGGPGTQLCRAGTGPNVNNCTKGSGARGCANGMDASGGRCRVGTTPA